MLVLSRKPGQTIAIGDSIRIKVVEIGAGHVRIGIEAPSEMPIYREELYEKLKQLNIEAAKLEMTGLKALLGTVRDVDKKAE